MLAAGRKRRPFHIDQPRGIAPELWTMKSKLLIDSPASRRAFGFVDGHVPQAAILQIRLERRLVMVVAIGHGGGLTASRRRRGAAEKRANRLYGVGRAGGR